MSVYRLQTLLEIRERAEEAAKQAFAEASRELHKAQEELKRLEDDLERRKRERKERVEAYFQELMQKGTTGLSGMTLMNRFEQRLKDEEIEVGLQIERQKDAVRAAEEVVDQRRIEMAEAARDKKAMDKHKEKWVAERKKIRDDREQLNQEEIGSALFLARSRK